MLRLSKVAVALDVSVSSVRRLIKDGTLAAGFVRGQLRVSRRDLDDYISRVLRGQSEMVA